MREWLSKKISSRMSMYQNGPPYAFSLLANMFFCSWWSLLACHLHNGKWIINYSGYWHYELNFLQMTWLICHSKCKLSLFPWTDLYLMQIISIFVIWSVLNVIGFYLSVCKFVWTWHTVLLFFKFVVQVNLLNYLVSWNVLVILSLSSFVRGKEL